MAVNEKLLRRTLKHIKAHPDKWDQGDWRCETSMCFAGWACQLSGGQWLNKYPSNKIGDSLLLAKMTDGLDIERYNDFQVVRASKRATRLLRLNDHQAKQLFFGDNNLERLEKLVEGFIAAEAA